MANTLDNGFFSGATPGQLLDLIVDETAGSLSLLADFALDELAGDDEIVEDRPGADEGVRIAFRYGFKTPRGARMGFLQVPLDGALVLAGALLMLPTNEISEERSKDAPDEGHKEAIMEAGHLLASAFDAAVRKRCEANAEVQFFGCQGVGGGEAPWVASYAGEKLAVRRQNVSVAALDPFEVLIAVPI
ncbi:MAG: hypothetical protein AAFZ87_02105 [Planctomycetota bacterium]